VKKKALLRLHIEQGKNVLFLSFTLIVLREKSKDETIFITIEHPEQF
jgi:hypothetical protein